MMELENIVANTQFLKAMEGKGKSKKWREMLKFPHIKQCAELAKTLEQNGDLTYSAIEKSPIGKELFLGFCAQMPPYKFNFEFVQAIASYRVAQSSDYPMLAKNLVDNFLKNKNNTIVSSEIMDKVISSVNSNTLTALTFDECSEKLDSFFSGQPLQDFKKTHWFSRLLQWKYLSQKPVDREIFRFYRVLGKGGFGEVHACQKRDTGKMYAVKCLDKKRIKKKKGESLAWNERDLLAKVDSRFVAGLKYAFETKEQLCMVLDLMNGGDLQFHLSYSERFEDERARFYAAEMVLGLQHLHKLNLLYRDMKPENMLLNDKGHVCLSDLGLAVELKPPKNVVKGRVGTPGYMAPEVLGGEKYGVSADWWGLGCVIYDMIAGHSPFRARKEKLRVDKLQQRVLETVVEYDSHFSEDAKDLCSKLLEKDPTKRLGCKGEDAEEIKRHPYFQKVDWIRLEAGLVPPPYVPSPHQVNAKDVLDIDRFDSIKDVKLTENDNELYSKFPTVIAKCWENEIMETVFKELNPWDENNLPADLRNDISVEQYANVNLGFFGKLKQKFTRQRSDSTSSKTDDGTSSSVSNQTQSLASFTTSSSSSTTTATTTSSTATSAAS